VTGNKVAAAEVAADEAAILTATKMVNGVTVTATKNITLRNVSNPPERIPESIQVLGATLVQEKTSSTYTAKVVYSDGSKEDLSEYVQTSKSSFGRGGMLTKCSIAQKVADEGITVIIANGKKDNILVDLLAKDSRTVCTRFIPSNKPVSSVKKWIAHSEGFAKGEIHINRGAEEALLGPKATSILLVGVTRIIGDFEKDDIVKVINEEGVQLGVGCAGYDSTEARELIGSRDKKPLVHYDYLYLD
jgi:glutamate 5-kinase